MGLGVSNAFVTITNQNNRTDSQSYQTDENGLLSLDEMYPGVYEMRVEKDGYESVIKSVMIKPSDSDWSEDIPLTETNPSSEYTGGVTGYVMGESSYNYIGSETKGIQLKLYKAMDGINGTVLKSTVTGENGQYYLDGLAQGDYLLVAEDHRDVPVPYDQSVIVVRIRMGVDVAHEDIHLSSAVDDDTIRIEMKWDNPEVFLRPFIMGMPQSNWLYEHPDGYEYTPYVSDYRKMDGIKYTQRENGLSKLSNPQKVTINYSSHQRIYCIVQSIYNEPVNGIQDASVTVEVYRKKETTPIKVYHPQPGEGRYWGVFRYDGKTETFTELNQVGKYNSSMDYPYFEEWE